MPSASWILNAYVLIKTSSLSKVWLLPPHIPQPLARCPETPTRIHRRTYPQFLPPSISNRMTRRRKIVRLRIYIDVFPLPLLYAINLMCDSQVINSPSFLFGIPPFPRSSMSRTAMCPFMDVVDGFEVHDRQRVGLRACIIGAVVWVAEEAVSDGIFLKLFVHFFSVGAHLAILGVEQSKWAGYISLARCFVDHDGYVLIASIWE